MKLEVPRGKTSKKIRVLIQDSTSTTGGGLTGLAFGASGLLWTFFRDGDSSSTAVTLATAALGTWSTGGFKEVDASLMPGVYELGVPNACLSTGESTQMILKGAANMVPCAVEIELTSNSNQDGVTGGMTALPNAAASASGGLLTFGGSTGQINPSSGKVPGTLVYTDVTGFLPANVSQWIGGTIPSIRTTGVPLVDVSYINGTAQTGRDIGASVLLSSGTGTGQISLAAGLVALASAQTFTNSSSANQTGDSFARIGLAGVGLTNIVLPSGGLANVTAWTVAITGNVTGNLSGSVGSVTGLTASNLDATISSRSTYAGADTAGTGTLLARLTSTRAGLLDNLDAAISTRSTFAGGAVASVTGNVGGIAGTVQTLDALITAENTVHGAGSWATATGFALASSWTAGLATSLSASFASSGVFSPAALANAPTGGGSAPTVEQIDAQLSGTHGGGSWGSSASGTGANAVTITVTDGTDPVPNATVRFGSGINQFTAVSNGSGVAAFSLDNATYDVTLSKSGYTFAPTTLTISTTTAHTYALTANVITPPTDGTLCRVYCYSEKVDASSPAISFSLIPIGRQAPADRIYTGDIITATFADGYAEAIVVRTDSSGAPRQYRATCPPIGLNVIITLTAGTYALAPLVPAS